MGLVSLATLGYLEYGIVSDGTDVANAVVASRLASTVGTEFLRLEQQFAPDQLKLGDSRYALESTQQITAYIAALEILATRAVKGNIQPE